MRALSLCSYPHLPLVIFFYCAALPLQIEYMETSAKDPPVNVDNLFHDLVRIIRRQPVQPPLPSNRTDPKKVRCTLL
ncbi:hypothetical protein PHET_09799 [Paragonimus heterotremus]|uniref:G protein gamma domain-containing protein n=1 Tax=Paragonimus heterotremus TaxID=100268 RepID=A0A8J4WND1_9TREM|nr:hypothetical protein PHET_09799 [Paragonimus heterotremus]